MATSSSGIRKGKDTLRREILSYKPGKAVPRDEVVFPDKLVIGMVELHGQTVGIVPALRSAIHGNVCKRRTSTNREKYQEDHLTDSISVITSDYFVEPSQFEEIVQDLAGKVACMALIVNPIYVSDYTAGIKTIKSITGHVPLCTILSTGRREAIDKAKDELKHYGITDIYELPHPDHSNLSTEDHLQCLDLLHGCLQEGDRVFANDDLKNMCTNPRCTLLYNKTKKESKEANQKIIKEIEERKQERRSLRNEIKELERECEESFASYEGLVNDHAVLKNEMVHEKEKRMQVTMTLADNEKIAKHAMEMYKERQLELEEKLKSKDLHIGTMAEHLQKTEETVRRAVERLQTEKEDERAKAEKERCSLAAEMTKKLESKQQRIDSLTKIVEEKERNEMNVRQQVEELENERQEDRARFEQLERETWKLRTNIQLESEIRSAEQKKKSETPQWMQILIPWTNYGNLARRGITSSEDNSIGECYPPGRSTSSDADVELPNDEFADILKQIADDLSDEAKIDSLGSQLGVLRGDIARALKTNMRYEQITSRGTHLMLKQWRKGVSREDERNELRRALVAAKLLDLAVHYLPQEGGGGTGPEQPQKMKDSHQLVGIDNTSSAQGYSGGQTNTRETTAATGQPRLHDQSSKNQVDAPSECMDQLSEELSNQSTAGVHDTSKDIPYVGGLTGLEHPQKIEEAPGSSGGHNKTKRPTTTTHQALDDTSPKNQWEGASEGMDQYSEESSINNMAESVRETSVDVYSSEPFDEGTSISDERGVECTTINYSDLLSNIALTETSSEKLLMIFLMKVFIGMPSKVFDG